MERFSQKEYLSLKMPADDLQKVTADTFNQLLEPQTDTTGIHVSQCPIMIVSGNTTMIHFSRGWMPGQPLLPSIFAEMLAAKAPTCFSRKKDVP